MPPVQSLAGVAGVRKGDCEEGIYLFHRCHPLSSGRTIEMSLKTTGHYSSFHKIRGGGGVNGKGHPDPKIRLGRLGLKNNFFRPSVLSLVRSRLLLLVWSKNKGGLPWIRQCRSPSPSPLMGSWPVSLVRIIGAPSPWSPFSTFSGIMN